ncbi:MAG: hypothetical protein ACRCX8_08425 [Sarcina sp.]
MYKAIFNLNNKKIEGTLTFYVLKKIQEEMLINFNRELTISDIFKYIAEDDMEVVAALLICSTNQEFDLEKSDIEEIYKYIKRLLEICMPLKEENDNDFEDIPDFTESKDWEFEWMEYMWNTTLKRTDEFLNITPKRFFEQIELYKKINKIQQDENVEEI